MASETMTLSEAVEQATARHWRVTLNLDGAWDGWMSANRGDCNCPHQGAYRQIDGRWHGYEEKDEEGFDALDELVALLEALPEVAGGDK